MKIRSITYFCNPRLPLRAEVLQEAGAFLRLARTAYQEAGYEVQTTRLATTPFPEWVGEAGLSTLPRVAHEVEMLTGQLEIGYVSLGPASPQVPRSYEVIPEAIAATKSAFFGGTITNARKHLLDMDAVRRCASIIARCAPIEPNGFANLRFAALANVPAGSPFFPAAYHRGGTPTFAIATEAADLAVHAFTAAKTVSDGKAALTAAIQKHAAALARVARELRRRPRAGGVRTPRADVRFGGLDFSLAPFPHEETSLGTAFERMGVPRVGLHGSLAAAAILTDAIDQARFERAGFSGLLLPVLEDATLAARAAEGTLSIKDVLLYSAVCGSGLDTIPLPGDASEGQIAAVLVDVAALSLRLDKPLTARLMPVPRKKAGDPTGFHFEYMVNSKVMRLEAEALQGPLCEGRTILLKAR